MKNNIQQKKSITTIDGPVLIVAGPGTGKTFTLVERVVHMVVEKEIDPSEIMITTFTNKASLELLDRLSLKFSEKNIVKDVNEMLLGNFHKVCTEILNRYIDKIPLKKGFTRIDDVEQKYLIKRYLNKFYEINNIDLVVNRNNPVKDISTIVNKICEEGILERKSSDLKIQAIFDIISMYESIIEALNMLSFSHILYYTYKLLAENPSVRAELQKKINYIMIDEYQDTNSVQEKIVFALLNENKNICVVGDDDQALYRFRGATVRNILNFDKQFEDVTVIKLMQNYRSQDDIIKFYTKYLDDLIIENPQLAKFRLKKILYSDKVSESPKVGKLVSDSVETWMEKTYEFVLDLMKNDLVNSLNEIAILVSSVNDSRVVKLISYLKEKGIGVYIPKTSTLLSQKEVLRLVGALYSIFKPVLDLKIYDRDPDTTAFFERCFNDFYKFQLKDDSLNDFVERMRKYLRSESVNLNLHDILYRLFAYEPFFTYMKDENKAKNISRFLEVINSFNLVNNLHQIRKDNIEIFSRAFFFNFLSFIKNEKLSGFEEETKIPDENSLSVLTIHASKGMEYPVVIMASLWDFIGKPYVSDLDRIFNSIAVREDGESLEEAKLLDHYRKYYTAFSRAKELLILSALDTSQSRIIKENRKLLDMLEEKKAGFYNIEKLEAKENKIKKKYSYTRDISLYNKSPLLYYYQRVLKFSEPKTKALFYGQIVHESIDIINREIINGINLSESEVSEIVLEVSRSKFREGAQILKEDVNRATKEVLKYLDVLNDLGTPLESELNITLSTENYILTGNVDMIYEKDSKYHIIDFKTGTPPNENGEHESLESYINQINLYAYLFKKTKNTEIDSVSLYFTDLNASKPLLKFKFDEERNLEVLKMIEQTIEKIEREEFFEANLENKNFGLLNFFFTKYFN